MEPKPDEIFIAEPVVRLKRGARERAQRQRWLHRRRRCPLCGTLREWFQMPSIGRVGPCYECRSPLRRRGPGLFRRTFPDHHASHFDGELIEALSWAEATLLLLERAIVESN